MVGNDTTTLTVYADYVCPFCYLGYASLDRYRERREEPLPTDWHPFDLRADRRRADGSIDADAAVSGSEAAYFEQARENVRRLAAEYDVEMATDLRRDVDSYDAQRVAWAATEQYPDAFRAFHRAVFAALWEEGRDVGDDEVLRDLTTDAGIPDYFVDRVLSEDRFAADLESAFSAARDRAITGVPTFVRGSHAARGAVPPEQLERLIEGACV